MMSTPITCPRIRLRSAKMVQSNNVTSSTITERPTKNTQHGEGSGLSVAARAMRKKRALMKADPIAWSIHKAKEAERQRERRPRRTVEQRKKDKKSGAVRSKRYYDTRKEDGNLPDEHKKQKPVNVKTRTRAEKKSIQEYNREKQRKCRRNKSAQKRAWDRKNDRERKQKKREEQQHNLPPDENENEEVHTNIIVKDLNYESMGRMGRRKKQMSLARKAKKRKQILIDAFWEKNLDKMDFSCLHHPVVIMDKIKTWPAASWTPETLRALLGDKKFNFKIGQQQNEKDGVVWESECRHVEATIGDFLAWLDDQCTDSNPLQYFPRMENWVYLDYKYIAQMFEDQTHIYKDVLWERFGFEGRDGADSTLWMGSEGSYTPCHYDTYGCNLVAQIYGRKRWFLFPPDKMNNLYPTRIPYEESSVFSHVDIKRPNLEKYPLFKETCPIVVTLKPGDVLFVPKHWWHFVESLETSISINTWIELESDHMDRFTESVCQTLVNSLMSSAQSPQEEWLNTGQTSQNHDANLLNLETTLKALPKEAPSAYNASQLRKRPADIAQSSDQGSELKRCRHQQEDNSQGAERGSERTQQKQQGQQAKSKTILFQNTDSGICEILKIETAPDFEFDCEDNYSGYSDSEMDQLNGDVSGSSSGANVVSNSMMGPSTSKKASEMFETLSCDCEFELCRILNLHGSRHKSPYVQLLDPIPFAEYLEEFTLNERLHENGLKLNPKPKPDCQVVRPSFQDENPEPVGSSSHVFKSEPVSPSSHDSNSEPVGPASCEFKSEPVSPPSQDSSSGPFGSHESYSEQTRTSSHEFKWEPVDPTEIVRPASHGSISESVGPSARDLFTKFVNAVTHPEIVRKIAEKLKEEFI